MKNHTSRLKDAIVEIFNIIGYKSGQEEAYADFLRLCVIKLSSKVSHDLRIQITTALNSYNAGEDNSIMDNIFSRPEIQNAYRESVQECVLDLLKTINELLSPEQLEKIDAVLLKISSSTIPPSHT